MPERRAARPPRSRRVGSLRRSSRRLADHDEPQATDESADRQGAAGSRPGRADTDRAEGWPRFRASLLQPGRGQVIAAVMLFVVGLAGVMQIRINTTDDTYTTARAASYSGASTSSTAGVEGTVKAQEAWIEGATRQAAIERCAATGAKARTAASGPAGGHSDADVQSAAGSIPSARACADTGRIPAACATASGATAIEVRCAGECATAIEVGFFLDIQSTGFTNGAARGAESRHAVV